MKKEIAELRLRESRDAGLKKDAERLEKEKAAMEARAKENEDLVRRMREELDQERKNLELLHRRINDLIEFHEKRKGQNYEILNKKEESLKSLLRNEAQKIDQGRSEFIQEMAKERSSKLQAPMLSATTSTQYSSPSAFFLCGFLSFAVLYMLFLKFGGKSPLEFVELKGKLLSKFS